jgi:hypothetical protein
MAYRERSVAERRRLEQPDYQAVKQLEHKLAML